MMPSRDWGSESLYKFGYQGSLVEEDVLEEGRGLYSTYFRNLDTRVVRWWSVDPKTTAFLSPYASMTGNPILYNDQYGDTTYRFNQTDGKYIGMYDLDASGQFGSFGKFRTIGEGTDALTQWDGEYFNFADPINDPKGIQDGTITQLVFVSETEIYDMLYDQGAFNPDDKNRPGRFKKNSEGGQKFDYAISVLPYRYEKQGATYYPPSDPSHVLFLPEGEFTAHNQMNFGNYLWAATGFTLGFEIAILQMGAHANSRNPRAPNGHEPEWDSEDDQRSIKKGAYHAIKHDYREKLETIRQRSK